VLVLRDERAAALVQAALNRVYNQFWRHQLAYAHATMNCAGISIDVLRVAGLGHSMRESAKQGHRGLGFPYFAAKERSVAKARIAFDYLNEDQTRLMPAAAFEECGAAALELVKSGRLTASGPLARMLAEDIEAIAFVRLPQFPSSRAIRRRSRSHTLGVPVADAVRSPAEADHSGPRPPVSRSAPRSDLIDGKRYGSDYATAIWGRCSSPASRASSFLS
jgi:hypothetical protein